MNALPLVFDKDTSTELVSEINCPFEHLFDQIESLYGYSFPDHHLALKLGDTDKEDYVSVIVRQISFKEITRNSGETVLKPNEGGPIIERLELKIDENFNILGPYYSTDVEAAE